VIPGSSRPIAQGLVQDPEDPQPAVTGDSAARAATTRGCGLARGRPAITANQFSKGRAAI